MPYKDKDRQRAYAQRPDVKDRKRAYAQRPDVKDRQRAYKRDLARIKQRLELDASGIDAIMAAVHGGQRYIDIAGDWLIAEADVTAIAVAHGVSRRPRRRGVSASVEARP